MTPALPAILGCEIVVAQITDVPPWISQLGFGGIIVWVVLSGINRIDSRLERMEHTQRGLSSALWADLAARSPEGSFIYEQAKKMLSKMENSGGKDS